MKILTEAEQAAKRDNLLWRLINYQQDKIDDITKKLDRFFLSSKGRAALNYHLTEHKSIKDILQEERDEVMDLREQLEIAAKPKGP